MRGPIVLCLAVSLCLSSAASAADDQPICPDRPSKSTGPCTVPAGEWQIETGLADWTHDRSDEVSTDLTQWAGSALKYGVAANADVELWVTPLETLRTSGSGGRQTHSSFGDTLLRVKYELTRADAPIQVAIDPFVKLPTANHWLGNGKVEGGLLAPVAVPLGKTNLTLSDDPEADLLADPDGRGYGVATQQVVNLGWAINDRLNVSGELWGMWQRHAPAQRSADASIAFLPSKRVAIDAGVNAGLNKATPAVELYTGISAKF